MRDIRVEISEGGFGFVDRSEVVRKLRREVTQLVFPIEIGISYISAAFEEVEPEENRLSFFTLAAWHGRNDLLGYVEPAVGGRITSIGEWVVIHSPLNGNCSIIL